MPLAGALLVVLLAGFVPAAAAPTLEDQVDAIAGELMCQVCAGQTVAESNSPLAIQMRLQIRERLTAGQSREDILAFFVSQFGESVLAAPPKRGIGLALWLTPVLAFAVGLIVMARYLRKTMRPATPSPS
ncbi:MAG: cytochrome c-type biogenesis protein [bacterium]